MVLSSKDVSLDNENDLQKKDMHWVLNKSLRHLEHGLIYMRKRFLRVVDAPKISLGPKTWRSFLYHFQCFDKYTYCSNHLLASTSLIIGQ